MKKIIIVGGGTAGLISALILKQTFNCNLKIIKSDKIGIIGVGEGSTEHWSEFLRYCHIDWKELIQKTDATLKYGIRFTRWTEKEYFHQIDDYAAIKYGSHIYSYLKDYTEDNDAVVSTDWNHLENLVHNEEHCVANQFHFNTFKLNEFLLNKCKERDIEIIDDEINFVGVADKGITSIVGTKEYRADFYVDCTGMKRLLISKLGAKWKSYKDHLFMNEAIAFPTGDTDEYTPYTEARKMNAGWLWRIPTYGRWGNGYVYNNNKIDSYEAIKELRKEYNVDVINIGKHVKFEPGALDKTWIKNCVAVGLAANFVEPLEASSIGTTIQQNFLFCNYLLDSSNSEEFNNKMDEIMDNIRDFVLVHYLNDEDFKATDSLKDKLEIWSKRPPLPNDFQNDRLLFTEMNWVNILCGLKFFKRDIISNFIKMYNTQNRLIIEKAMADNKLNKYNKLNYISHKKWLEKIRTPMQKT